jgi:hypothetical protein
MPDPVALPKDPNSSGGFLYRSKRMHRERTGSAGRHCRMKRGRKRQRRRN